jgi:hypothetical protein
MPTLPPIIDLKDTLIYIRDLGTNYIAIRVGEGNFSYSNKRNIIIVKSRGILDRVREGEDIPCDVQFQFIWDHIKTGSGEVVSIEDALNHINGAAGWASTAINDPDAPFCVDIQLVWTPPCSGSLGENLYFSQFHWENLGHDLHQSSVDCTGKCNVRQPIAY